MLILFKQSGKVILKEICFFEINSAIPLKFKIDSEKKIYDSLIKY